MTTTQYKRTRLQVAALSLIFATMFMTGCGGAVNVQTSGGGADGFASLGVLMLGTSAIRYIRNKTYSPIYADDEPLPPPTRIEPIHEIDVGQAETSRNAEQAE